MGSKRSFFFRRPLPERHRLFKRLQDGDFAGPQLIIFANITLGMHLFWVHIRVNFWMFSLSKPARLRGINLLSRVPLSGVLKLMTCLRYAGETLPLSFPSCPQPPLSRLTPG